MKIKNITVVLLIMVIALLSACSTNEDNFKSIKVGTISGTVMTNENPIQNLTLSFSWNRNNNSFTSKVKTDINGLCSLKDIPYGEINIKVNDEKYETYNEIVNLDKTNIQKDITLTEINLPSVSGQIVNWYDKSPIKEVEIHLHHGGKETITNENG